MTAPAAGPMGGWRFPNMPRTLAGLLTGAGFVAAGRVGAETPANLEQVLPFIRVRRVGGASGQVDDRAVIDLDVFAADTTTGEPLAENVRQYLSQAGSLPAVNRAVIDRVEVISAPQELPWGDGTRVRRYGATYRITARRHRIS